MRISALIPLLLSAVSVSADKDISYYNANHGNPNVNSFEMYWKDSDNILDDLSKFSSLRIVYHSCVWSYVYDEADNEQAEDGSDTWYMGSVPSMGSNVAFSLYGTLKNGRRNKGCNEKTFINSFYTNTGFFEFVNSIQSAGVSMSSSYTSECGGYKGVGCDYLNGFALHEYSTEECNPQYFAGVLDTLDDLNQGMEQVQCIEIYNSKNTYYDDDSYGSSLDLLKYSNACNYMNYLSPDGDCPDPYGKIQKYINNYNNGIERAYHNDPYKVYNRRMRRSKTMILIGALSFILAGVVFHFFAGMSDPKQRARIERWRKKFGRNDDESEGKTTTKKGKATSKKKDKVMPEKKDKVMPEKKKTLKESLKPKYSPAAPIPAPTATPVPMSPSQKAAKALDTRGSDPPAVASPRDSTGSPLSRALFSRPSRSKSNRMSKLRQKMPWLSKKSSKEDIVLMCDTDDYGDDNVDRYAVPPDPPILLSQTASHSSTEIV